MIGRGAGALARAWAVGAALVVGAALLGGCAAPQTTAVLHARPAGLPTRVLLGQVPFFPQEDYQCGPAALAGAIGAAGFTVDPAHLASNVFVPAREGSFQVEMLAAPRRYGFLGVRIGARVEDLLRELAAGTPVVVFQNLSLPIWPMWHYAVAIGYDLDQGDLFMNSGRNEHIAVSLSTFEHTWARGTYWAMTVTPPDRLPVTAREIDVAQAAAGLEPIDAPAALRAYDAMLVRWPDDRVALFGRGNILYARRYIEDAVVAWRAAVSAHPDFGDGWNNLALALADLGRYDEARAAIGKALALGGAHEQAYLSTRDHIDTLTR